MLVDGLDMEHLESLVPRARTHHLWLFIDFRHKEFLSRLVHDIFTFLKHCWGVEHDLLSAEVSGETLAWVARSVWISLVPKSYSLCWGWVTSTFNLSSAGWLVVVSLQKRAFVHLASISRVTDLPSSAMAVHDLLTALAYEPGVGLLPCLLLLNLSLSFDPGLLLHYAVFHNFLLGLGCPVTSSFSEFLSLPRVRV